MNPGGEPQYPHANENRFESHAHGSRQHAAPGDPYAAAAERAGYGPVGGQAPASGQPEGPEYPAYGQEPTVFGPEHTVVQGSVVARHDESAGYPPPPPYGPGPSGDGFPSGDAAPHGRRRARRPYALIAAAALVAAIVGGGTGALIGRAGDTGHSATATAAVNASAIDGTVAGVYKAVNPSVVEINATSQEGKSTGAGVIITSNGQIVTNNHVIAGAQEISVTYSNGKTAAASLVGADAKKDLALIKVNGASGLPAAVLGDSSGLAVGDQVVAIGSPEGLSDTVTSGIVSALNRDVTVPVEDGQSDQSYGSGSSGGYGYGGGSGDQWPFSFGGNQYNGSTGSSTTTYKAIQTDASLNPGNSGGALINMSGQIVGINSAMYSSSSSSDDSSSDAGSVGLGFAIPINTVKADLSYLRSGGDSS